MGEYTDAIVQALRRQLPGAGLLEDAGRGFGAVQEHVLQPAVNAEQALLAPIQPAWMDQLGRAAISGLGAGEGAENGPRTEEAFQQARNHPDLYAGALTAAKYGPALIGALRGAPQAARALEKVGGAGAADAAVSAGLREAGPGTAAARLTAQQTMADALRQHNTALHGPSAVEEWQAKQQAADALDNYREQFALEDAVTPERKIDLGFAEHNAPRFRDATVGDLATAKVGARREQIAEARNQILFDQLSDIRKARKLPEVEAISAEDSPVTQVGRPDWTRVEPRSVTDQAIQEEIQRTPPLELPGSTNPVSPNRVSTDLTRPDSPLEAVIRALRRDTSSGSARP